MFLLHAVTVCFGATELVNGSYGSLIPNISSWSSRASGHLEVLARNLTFSVSSNQAAGQLPVAIASNVP
jgi:hypothetical protein